MPDVMSVLHVGEQQTVEWLKHSDTLQNTPPPNTHTHTHSHTHTHTHTHTNL